MGPRLNSEILDSFAPAYFGLSAQPIYPRGSIREQAI